MLLYKYFFKTITNWKDLTFQEFYFTINNLDIFKNFAQLMQFKFYNVVNKFPQNFVESSWGNFSIHFKKSSASCPTDDSDGDGDGDDGSDVVDLGHLFYRRNSLKIRLQMGFRLATSPFFVAHSTFLATLFKVSCLVGMNRSCATRVKHRKSH